MKRGKCSRKDYISDLPQSIIDSILTKLPIRDAVKTSSLSTKWRYQWATMGQLVFDERPDDRKLTEQELANFITRFLFLHHGPIHKFKLITSYFKTSSDIDQWLLYLSRKDIKELVLGFCGYNWPRKDQKFHLPSCIFSCQKLTKLKLHGFDVKPLAGFQGFPCLKYLNLSAGPFTPEVIENLISGCPLLENFIFTNVADPLALAIYAPNLKYLTLDGLFTNLYLKHTPLLVALCIDFFARAWEGNVLMKVPNTYNCLKFIKLQAISYKETNNALNVLHLIMRSPNLQELRIEAKTIVDDKAADLDLWEKECSTDFTFKNLSKVLMSGVSNENCMLFLSFVLGHSPALKVMSVSPYEYYKGKMKMANEVLHFRRASPKVDIRFFD